MKAGADMKKILAILFWGLFLALTIYLCMHAMMPASVSSLQSKSFSLWISKVLSVFIQDPSGQGRPIHEWWDGFYHFVRKAVGHFGAFVLLGVFGTLALVFSMKKTYRYALSLGMGIGVAGLTEILQLFADGRAGMFSDVLLDTAGYVCGGSIVLIFTWLVVRKKQKFDGKNKKSRKE